VDLIRHEAAQVVGAVRIVLIAANLSDFRAAFGIAQRDGAEEVETSGEPTGQRIALPSRLAIEHRAPAPDLWQEMFRVS